MSVSPLATGRDWKEENDLCGARRSKGLSSEVVPLLQILRPHLENRVYTQVPESTVGKWQEADGGQYTTWDCQEVAAVLEMTPEHGSSSGLSQRINSDGEELERFGWGTLR